MLGDATAQLHVDRAHTSQPCRRSSTHGRVGKVAVLLEGLMFSYDVFMVFISPIFFHASVMVRFISLY